MDSDSWAGFLLGAFSPDGRSKPDRDRKLQKVVTSSMASSRGNSPRVGDRSRQKVMGAHGRYIEAKLLIKLLWRPRRPTTFNSGLAARSTRPGQIPAPRVVAAFVLSISRRKELDSSLSRRTRPILVEKTVEHPPNFDLLFLRRLALAPSNRPEPA